MPIATYPGLALIGATVRDIVTNPHAQFQAQLALHRRYSTPFLLSAMDLSVEAEGFGCAIAISQTEVPTVAGRLITSLAEAQSLAVPTVGIGRTAVYLEAVQLLRRFSDKLLVLGGCIGPFSLAARLAGVTEALEWTATEPDLMHLLLVKSTQFLSAYARAFRDAGADCLIMAEPAAGLLSPRSLALFSSAYVRSISESCADAGFSIILHNCGAKLVHLPAILESGVATYHFGAPMDLPGALGKVPPDVVLCGNLDPARVFCQLSPAEVRERAAALVSATSKYHNCVLSSGCDLPPNVPLANLDGFYAAVHCPPTGAEF
jgi:uroporphyrinogen decarboxylase